MQIRSRAQDGSLRPAPRDEVEPATHVPSHLLPVRTFDAACRQVVDYLAQLAPMGLWAVTRIADGRQLVLAAEGAAYPVHGGDVFPYEKSFCRWMVAGVAPQVARDVADVPEYSAAAAEAPIAVQSYVGIPIVRSDGELFGTVCGYDPDRRPALLAGHEPLLALLSSLLSAVLEADLAAVAAARELEQARTESDLDPLTGLLNRRGWDRYLEREEERFRRFGDPASVVVIDLDNLKTVNDTHGHATGDRYIQRAADVLARTVRDGDLLARLGGDEFGIVAVGATSEQAVELTARCRRAMTSAGVAGSFGHAPYTAVLGFPGAWHAADVAMYEQKRQCRGHPGRPPHG